MGFVDWNAPIWGVTDMQTHLMSHLGFGGKIVHGAPDAGFIPTGMSSCDQKVDLKLSGEDASRRIDLALANSNPTHGAPNYFPPSNLCSLELSSMFLKVREIR